MHEKSEGYLNKCIKKQNTGFNIEMSDPKQGRHGPVEIINPVQVLTGQIITWKMVHTVK